MHDRIARTLELAPGRVRAALALFDDGNTVPFVARYRKEQTGGLDDAELRAIEGLHDKLKALEARRQTVLDAVRDQGELTPELDQAIRAADTATALEDLYAPYKRRRTTRGGKARAAGLQPVAQAIAEGGDPFAPARALRCDAFPTVDAVIAGAQDILAEDFAADARPRRQLRQVLRRHGLLEVKKKRGARDDPEWARWYTFTRPVRRLEPHQVLAVRRGEAVGAISASIAVDDDRTVRQLSRGVRSRLHREALADGYKRLLKPAAERDVRGALDETADAHAIDVFAINLRNLLLQPPLPGRVVLGLDPGYRTGCKAAVVDRSGQLLGTGIVHVHDGRAKRAPATLRALIEAHGVEVVAVGNGTGSSESQVAVAEAIEGTDVAYAVVDEAGASVYSASELGSEELPDLDVSYRGAVSIARRLQDPLAELVKIDPRSIGVGLYQHDVHQGRLGRALEAVVEDVVNGVGVDLQTASPRLLTFVAGIGPTLASRIVAHRSDRGLRRRRDLTAVKGLGAKTFEQCAGFLRLDGPEPLDATPIHPESYPVARAILESAGVGLGDAGLDDALQRLRRDGELARLAERFGVGEYTLDDVCEALVRPGRDPRDAVAPPRLRAEPLTLADLVVGQRYPGTVRNVVDFGAFVDIGAKEDGLVHVSKMADRFVRNPHEVVAVGDRVEVTVVKVDVDRKRIGLSMV